MVGPWTAAHAFRMQSDCFDTVTVQTSRAYHSDVTNAAQAAVAVHNALSKEATGSTDCTCHVSQPDCRLLLHAQHVTTTALTQGQGLKHPRPLLQHAPSGCCFLVPCLLVPASPSRASWGGVCWTSSHTAGILLLHFIITILYKAATSSLYRNLNPTKKKNQNPAAASHQRAQPGVPCGVKTPPSSAAEHAAALVTDVSRGLACSG
jgi:hypothetical protein